MVLVAVGQDHAEHVGGAFDEPAPIREDQVDSKHLLFGEHQPTVDQHDLLIDLQSGAVATDAAEAAEKGDGDGHR